MRNGDPGGCCYFVPILGLGTVVTINKRKKKKYIYIYLETNRCSCGKQESTLNHLSLWGQDSWSGGWSHVPELPCPASADRRLSVLQHRHRKCKPHMFCYHRKYIFPLAPLSDTLKPWKMPQKISHALLCSFHLFELFSALQVLYQHHLYKGISLLLISIADIIIAEGLLGPFISEQWTMGREQHLIRGLSTYLWR